MHRSSHRDFVYLISRTGNFMKFMHFQPFCVQNFSLRDSPKPRNLFDGYDAENSVICRKRSAINYRTHSDNFKRRKKADSFSIYEEEVWNFDFLINIILIFRVKISKKLVLNALCDVASLRLKLLLLRFLYLLNINRYSLS